MSSISQETSALIISLNASIALCENLLKDPETKAKFLLKIDGRYIERLDLSRYNIGANEEEDSEYFKLDDINKALHFDRNLAHRAKYLLDFHHDCTFEIVNFHLELNSLVDQRKAFIQTIERPEKTS